MAPGPGFLKARHCFKLGLVKRPLTSSFALVGCPRGRSPAEGCSTTVCLLPLASLVSMVFELAECQEAGKTLQQTNLERNGEENLENSSCRPKEAQEICKAEAGRVPDA